MLSAVLDEESESFPAKEKLRRGSSLTPDQLASDGLEYHSAATCLGCQRLRRVSHAADGAGG